MVWNNVNLIKCDNINCYVIRGNKGDVLIDTGLKKYRNEIETWLLNYDIKLIALTHGHNDHIENAAYSPTNCAERTAFFKAVSEGVHEFEAICVVGGLEESPSGYSVPCGVCRQVMTEFCEPAFPIIVAKDADHYELYTLQDLLPKSFGLF